MSTKVLDVDVRSYSDGFGGAKKYYVLVALGESFDDEEAYFIYRVYDNYEDADATATLILDILFDIGGGVYEDD